MRRHLTPDELLARLAELGIATQTREHAPVFTVAESASSRAKVGIPGGHSKNLFLKDKKGKLFLVVAQDDTRIDLKHLHVAIGASGRLSFGSAELLHEILGVLPGSVTPFAVVNDTACAVTVVLDARLMEHETVNFHPLENCRTTSLAREGLITFLRATGHEPRIMPLPAPAET